MTENKRVYLHIREPKLGATYRDITELGFYLLNEFDKRPKEELNIYDIMVVGIGKTESHNIENLLGGDMRKMIEESNPPHMEFRGHIGEPVGHGEAYAKLFQRGSLTVREVMALRNAYLLSKLGKGLLGVSPECVETLESLFCPGKGFVCSTVIDYIEVNEKNEVLWVDRPKLILGESRIEGGVKKKKPMPRTSHSYGFVGLDGFDEEGFPTRILNPRDPEEAIKTYTQKGFDREFAQCAIVNVDFDIEECLAQYRNREPIKRDLYPGIAITECRVGDDGMFNVSLRNPAYKSAKIGHVPVGLSQEEENT